MRPILASLVLLTASVALGAPAALAADDLGPFYGHAGGPSCDDWSVLARVTEKFSYQDRHVAGEGLAISGIDHVREQAPRLDGHGLVFRRYCSATAWLSNGHKSEVAYVIEGPALATFSVGWHVESCVVGHDPWRVYDARCRAIKP
jgi:hypothetical protein